MQVAKWGDSLVIQIPSSVVDAMGLKEGDEVSVHVSDPHGISIERDDRSLAMKKIKAFGLRLPPDWKLDRDDANAP